MTFDSIFAYYKNMVPFQLSDDRDSSIHLIQTEPFYVKPSFVDLRINRNPQIMVISAPGATGKSALAEYLAYKYSSIYWNLAEITLGDNSFVGTIVRSIGVDQYSEYMKCLLHGSTLLIIDAFDEAEMVSGMKAVRSFITEITKSVSMAEVPGVVLLARSETAHSICSCIEEKDIPYLHYEISYFDRPQSEEFVRQMALREGYNNNDPRMLDSCIKQYLNNISRLVQDENPETFAGYAPVLEVVGKHIASEKNAYSFLLSLTSEKMKNIDVLEKILQELLTREQKKVQESFNRRINEKFKDREFYINDIYDSMEQMTYLMTSVLFGPDDTYVDTRKIPEDLNEEYHEVCSSFVPQHPFLRIRSDDGKCEFAGPAFRDFVLAKMMESGKNEDLLSLYLDEKRVDHHFPSHLLWMFYTNHDDVIVASERVPYLFESFKSQSKGKKQTFLFVGGSRESGYISIWTIGTEKMEDDVSDSYELECNKELWFENLTNVNIDLEDLPVKVSNKSNNIQVCHSNVNCKALEMIADRIVFDVYEGMDSSLISTDEATIKSPSEGMSDITINGDNLLVDFPNITNYYKLIKYKFESEEDSGFSIQTFAYILRRIFVQFRKHKKDTPARDSEKIDFITIGEDVKRKQVFDFLVDAGIIYRDPQETHLYKIDTHKLEKYAISWGAIIRGDTEQLKNAYNEFIQTI